MTFATNLLRSRVIAAALGAAVINLWVGYGHPFSRVPTANLDKGEVFQTVKSYRKERSAPSVVFVGSSLMIAPVMQAEANLLGKPVERMTHRRSQFLEQELATFDPAPTAGKTVHAYCLGVGGAMVSDTYLMVKNVLRGQNETRAIVYGIAPRDFQDNLLPGTQSSESFRTIAQFDDLPEYLSSNQLTFDDKADLILSQISALWRYRSDAKVLTGLRTKKLMEASMPWVVFEKYGTTPVLAVQKHGQFAEEARGTPLIFPGAAMAHISKDATHEEYVRRYLPLKPALIEKEFEYLDRFLAICKQRKIPVIVVNMPLSHSNLSILPQGFYDSYVKRLNIACAAQQVDVIDMATSHYSDDDNFVDGVHLDSPKSQDFLHQLCARLANSNVAESIYGQSYRHVADLINRQKATH